MEKYASIIPTKDEAYIILERCFEENPSPNPADYLLLQAVTGMSKDGIQKCFARFRSEHRKKGTGNPILEYKVYRQLETFYSSKNNPSREEMQNMAEQLKVEESQVQEFFARKWHTRIEAESTVQNVEQLEDDPDSVIYI